MKQPRDIPSPPPPSAPRRNSGADPPMDNRPRPAPPMPPPPPDPPWAAETPPGSTLTSAIPQETLDGIEEKAWDALIHFRFAQFAHQAELWAALHKLSGAKRRNPFEPVARVAAREILKTRRVPKTHNGRMQGKGSDTYQEPPADPLENPPLEC